MELSLAEIEIALDLWSESKLIKFFLKIESAYFSEVRTKFY